MRCPVCGDDCVKEAHAIISTIPGVFARCRHCRVTLLDKSLPPPPDSYHEACRCGRRSIDEVFAHLYALLVREGIFAGKEALREVGSPLLHPGYPLSTPPFLPKDSLVLLSRYPPRAVAQMMVDEIPEVRGVVRSGDFIPGVIDPSLDSPSRTYDLLAGCDVRANVFPTKMGPVVLYQQQSTIHIEFPRRHNPKITSVEDRIARIRPEWFVDACCGAGTLGITAARLGVPHVILNDTWYAAAAWAAFNIGVNREFFRIDEVRIYHEYPLMAEHPVGEEPVLIAEAEGEQELRVYQGDLHRLPQVVPHVPVLAVIDLFDKSDRGASGVLLREWMAQVNGEAFIP
jgi:hypothetical protein